jgi:hypothetical protein
VRAQVDRGLTTDSWVDRLLGLIKNLGRQNRTYSTCQFYEQAYECVFNEYSIFQMVGPTRNTPNGFGTSGSGDPPPPPP